MMNYPTCPARTRITLWGKDGAKTHVQRCTDQDAERANANVEPTHCLECPLRVALVKDDTKHVPASKRPPKDHRAAFKPDKAGEGLPDCGKRLVMEIQPTCNSCSKPVKMRVCNEDKAPHFEGTVGAAICGACQFRS